jgi:hypothetical protein
MAIGAYLALGEAGVRVPQDMSVVGYDDQVQLAARMHPPLSTVRAPHYQMGRWAARHVVAGSVADLPRRTYLPCPPVARQSIAGPRATTTFHTAASSSTPPSRLAPSSTAPSRTSAVSPAEGSPYADRP